MAREARLSNSMTLPEINFAARLIQIRRLTPPIDVFQLANEYATIDEVDFPVSVDGVCLNLKQHGKRPRILVNRRLHKHRLRFTLAHEFGHIIIPWHVGSIVDETEESRTDLALTYWQLEGEANRFASELLMPSDWAIKILKAAKHPIRAAESISATAEVSFAAAMIRVQNLLPRGYLYAKFIDRELMSSGRTLGTLASMPDVRRVNPADLFPYAADHWAKSHGTEDYHLWRFHDETPLTDAPARAWRDIFAEISADINIPSAEVDKFKQRVMAVLSSANSVTRTSRTPEAVNSACIQRLHANIGRIPYIEAFLKHPKLGELLTAKIAEFFAT
jgi:Zn-dependent peptidase ImmA (M78 family)